MAITTINIGAAPNDHTGDTIRDSFNICNLNFQDLDTNKFNNPTGTSSEYLDGTGTPTTFPTFGAADTLITEVYNQTGGTLLRGSVVYISGAHGNLPSISPAIATSDATSAQTLGMVQNDISNNSSGFVVVAGKLGNLDTFAIAEGTQLYLSSTTAGFYTTTKQYAPNHLVYVGVVVRSHPTLGVIEVKIQNGYELDEIHNCAVQTPNNNDGLFYESATSLWKNKTIADVLGYTPANPNSVVKIIVLDTINSVPLSGSAETLIKLYQIPGGTFKANDFFKFVIAAQKTGGNGASTIRVKVNTANNFATSTLIATSVISPNLSLSSAMARFRMAFNSGNLEGVQASGNFQTDLGSTTAANFSIPLNVANDIWVFISLQNASGTVDTSLIDNVQITN